MANKESTPVLVDISDIKYLLCGMNQICEGMKDGVFSYSLDHYTGWDGRKFENALKSGYDCLHDNFNVIGGAFLMMEAATNIIRKAIDNGDLEIVPGDGKAGWKIGMKIGAALEEAEA